MQKIKNSVIEKMNKAKVTSNEFDFVFYISRFQDNKGCIHGLHYKELCEEMDMSYQGFYDAKQGLIDKGIISCKETKRGDHDITILDNECLNNENEKAGYTNTNRQIFYSKEFYNLKVGAKMLAVWLLTVCLANNGTFIIGLDKFYGGEYLKKFGVSKRVLRKYLMELKKQKMFFVGIKDRKYYISPQKTVYKKSGEKQETERLREHETDVVLRRNRIKKPGTGKKEIYGLFKQYETIANKLEKDLVKLLDGAVRKSLEIKNEGEKWIKNKIIDIKLIHKLLKELLYANKCEIHEEVKAPERKETEKVDLPRTLYRTSGKETSKRNRFNNFDQRVYDYDELERLLLYRPT